MFPVLTKMTEALHAPLKRAILTTNTLKLAMLHARETIATERTTADIHPASRAPAGHAWATQS